ncbi:hypothetical protein LCGC14_0839630 [marine sediment metagenome]|uniref:Uncharacterized protein n=1 Tax=marine sediment metagenome TaxID=412755 RepID=A0A0F9PDL1_9ZZZZ
MCTRLVYFPEAWGETWRPFTSSGGGPSSTSRSTSIASESSSSASPTASCPALRSGAISELSDEQCSDLIGSWLESIVSSSPPDSPACPSLRLDDNWERMMTAMCGPKQLALFEMSNPQQSYLRMFPVLSPLDTYSPYSGTWLRSVIRPFRHFGLRLVMLERQQQDAVFGLWPTPAARDRFCVKRISMDARCNTYRSRPTRCQLSEVLAGEFSSGHHPVFSQWLMQWPENWTSLQPLAMDKFRQWLQLHGDC